MGEEQPGAREDPLKLQIVNGLIRLDRRLDDAALHINETTDVQFIIHTRALPMLPLGSFIGTKP